MRLLVLATLLPSAGIRAQRAPPPVSTISTDSLPPGTFRGAIAGKENTDESPGWPALEPVTGTAQWRFELDSLDWRRKLTLRLVLNDPDRTVVVIRTADSSRPQIPLTSRPLGALSHVDARYFKATITVRATTERRTYDRFGGDDRVAVTTNGKLSSGEILRGSVNLAGFHHITLPREAGKESVQYNAVRIVKGEFSATFDPRPEAVPSTMTSDVQSRIVETALREFQLMWWMGRRTPFAADSTADDTKARAFLDNRWSEAAVVDSLAVGNERMYVRMRGRFEPVFCTLTDRSSSRCVTQAAPPPAAIAGMFRGTVAVQDDATDHTPVQPQPASGSARWRLELDSLDWRRKLTLRLALNDSARTLIVIRTANADAPRNVLRVKGNARSHIDPRYFMATMTVRENNESRMYRGPNVVLDTIVFDPIESLSPTAILRGYFHLEGFHDFSNYRKPGASYPQQKKRMVLGAFAATFDPRPERVPRSMTTALQTRILQEALYDFAINWMDYRVNASVADSTADNDKARAFLTNRWSEAAFVDSVAVGEKQLHVRMRGRYAPVTCVLDGRRTGSACSDSRHP